LSPIKYARLLPTTHGYRPSSQRPSGIVVIVCQSFVVVVVVAVEVATAALL
jgi:hypothetical protein